MEGSVLGDLGVGATGSDARILSSGAAPCSVLLLARGGGCWLWFLGQALSSLSLCGNGGPCCRNVVEH